MPLPDATRRACGLRNGAHDRNRTDDLLLTMEMLYRLSYVGFDDRDVQVGRTALDVAAVLEYCTGPTTWLSVLGSKDALPRGDFHGVKVVGAQREHRNLGLHNPDCQRENLQIWRFKPLRPDQIRTLSPRAAPVGCRSVQPSLEESWSGKRDSNPRPSAWKADALATELFPLKPLPQIKMVEGEGFEPSKASPTDLQSVPFDRSGTPPAVSGRIATRPTAGHNRAGEGTRTPNHLITNEMLYQLSYASGPWVEASGR